MAFLPSVLDAIGNTPLIKLKRASEETGCTILGKAEFLNPGQSVKDRAALFIIRDAEEKGLLRPGGTIVEGTAGNTGIGLALVAPRARLSHRHRHSRDPEPGKEGRAPPLWRRTRGSAGRALPQPQQLREGFRPACRTAGERAMPNGAIWANQFDNVANRAGPCRDHRARDLAADRRQGRRLHLRGRLRRHAGRRRRRPARRRAARRQDRARRPGRRGALRLLHDRRAQVRRQLDHRRHRPGPHHGESRRLQARFRLPHPRRRGPSADLRPARGRRPRASAARPASTSPAPSAWRARWARAIPS